MSYKLSKSSRKNKKFKVETPGGAAVHFGHSSYQDYTQHGDAARRASYRARHAGIKGSCLAFTKKCAAKPSFWSYHVLWGNSKGLRKNFNKVVKKLRN
jgi:hypothetical protein